MRDHRREFRYVRGKYSAIGIRESFGVKASVAAGYFAKLEGTLISKKLVAQSCR